MGCSSFLTKHPLVRSNLANLEIGGNQVFHTGNDGSGSGLDADTVDGIQGASFLRSDAADTLDAVLSVGQNGRIDFPDYSSVTDNPNTQVDYIRFGRPTDPLHS